MRLWKSVGVAEHEAALALSAQESNFPVASKAFLLILLQLLLCSLYFHCFFHNLHHFLSLLRSDLYFFVERSLS